MKLSERLRPNVEAAPWVIEEVKKIEAELACANSFHDGIGLGEGLANARLIAAAPELLEALEAMIEMHGVTQSYADKHIGIPQSWVEVSDLARAAIAKAKGEQP